MGDEKLSGAQALARALLEMGAERVYGIVGTSNVSFVDALYDERERLRYISCRHEQVAASMADAEGRLTGRPGVVLVHSGPGALNAMISAGNARKDCSGFMIIAGAVKRRLAGSDGMLELDHRKVFAPVCKGTYRVESTSEIPGVFSRAYRTAMSDARGPVLIEVPEDVWVETADLDISSMELSTDPPPQPRAKDTEYALQMLQSAKLPLILSGGGVAYSGSSGLLVKLAEAFDVPVITTGNGRGTIPEDHPLCLGRVGFGGGNLVADKALEKCDALLCLGAGLSDITTYEYTLPLNIDRVMIVNISDRLAPQAPECRLAVCDVCDFLKLATVNLTGEKQPERPGWSVALSEAKATWEGMRTACLNREGDTPSGARVMKRLGELLPDDTIVSVGAGMHLLYPMAFMPSRYPLTYLSTVNFGSMGFGMAACMAAKLVYPGRSSIAVQGDGDFMMTVQDLETAVRENIAVKIFVMNDNQYRVLNVRQKLQFQGRIYGTEHGNPDFSELAKCFGAAGYRIESPDDVENVLNSAVAEEGPVVVDVIIDPGDLPPMNIEANLRMSAGDTGGSCQ